MTEKDTYLHPSRAPYAVRVGMTMRMTTTTYNAFTYACWEMTDMIMMMLTTLMRDGGQNTLTLCRSVWCAVQRSGLSAVRASLVVMHAVCFLVIDLFQAEQDGFYTT